MSGQKLPSIGRGRGRRPIAAPAPAQRQAPEKCKVPRDERDALSTLGFDFVSLEPYDEGIHGTVYLAKCNEAAHCKPSAADFTEEGEKRSRKEVSIKGLLCVIKMSEKENEPGDLQREAQRLEELRHRNIVQVYGTLNAIYDNTPKKVKSRRYFVMEYINGGTLSERLKILNPDFTESAALNAISDITAGLHYLHGQGVYHMDLHGGNIMQHNEQGGKVVFKLVDFGSTKETKSDVDSNDIVMLGIHIADILGKSNFQREDVKVRLRQLSDDIIEEKLRDINHIYEHILRIIPIGLVSSADSLRAGLAFLGGIFRSNIRKGQK